MWKYRFKSVSYDGTHSFCEKDCDGFIKAVEEAMNILFSVELDHVDIYDGEDNRLLAKIIDF